MKKSILLLLSIFIVFLLVGCTTKETAQEEKSTKIAQMTYAAPKFLEEAISDSYTILMGTFIGSYKSSEIDNLSYYEFTVSECLKGSIPANEIITVEAYDEVIFIDNKSFYEKGEDYIILLSKFESVYIGDNYMPNGNFLISVEKGSIKEIYQKGTEYELEDNYTVSKFKTLLKTSLDKTDSYGAALGNKYTTSTKADEIAKYSDLIIEAKVIENISPEGSGKNGVGIYSIEILDVKKGTCTGLDAIYMFKDKVIIGDKYLFMLSYPSTKFEEAYSISSKNSCIPISDTEKYEEYMSYINK